MLLFVASPAWSADEWLVTRPALADDQWTAWPAASQANNKSIDRLLANYREGMVISYSSATTVSVSDGEVMCSNSGGTVRKMRQNPSATDVTFADIDTGAEEASKTYYVYAVADADATTATFKVSLSATAPTGITYYKKLGSFYNDSSSNILNIPITNDNSYYLFSGMGAWESKTDSAVYQALKDGFVIAYNRGSANVSLTAYSDASNPPTTIRMVGAYTSSIGEEGRIFMPVRKNDYYKVVGSPAATVWYVSIGN